MQTACVMSMTEIRENTGDKTMTTMMMAVGMAGLERTDFSDKRVVTPSLKVKWPRKRHNGTVGVRVDVKTLTKLNKTTN